MSLPDDIVRGYDEFFKEDETVRAAHQRKTDELETKLSIGNITKDEEFALNLYYEGTDHLDKYYL